MRSKVKDISVSSPQVWGSDHSIRQIFIFMSHSRHSYSLRTFFRCYALDRISHNPRNDHRHGWSYQSSNDKLAHKSTALCLSPEEGTRLEKTSFWKGLEAKPRVPSCGKWKIIILFSVVTSFGGFAYDVSIQEFQVGKY